MANPQNPDQKQQKAPSEPPKEQPREPDNACDELPTGPEPPELCPPKTCDFRCNCPGKPTPPEPPCFEKLIADQTALASQGERASKTKADLAKMLEDANNAKGSYTREKFEDFKKRWTQQDKDIVGAIQVVICNIPCWWCVIDCHVCQLLYRIRWIEERLDGAPGKLIGEVHSLRDLEHWHERNVDAKRRRFDRIDAVLKAWNDPAKSIDDALKTNEQIIASVRSMDPADSLVKVFFELIPRHLAIAPRPIDTQVEDKYINLCTKCDEGTSDDCCGPDVGLPTARQRLIGPQAYVIDPDRYFKLLCCIATERFGPAKQQLEDAQAGLAKTVAEIDSLKADLEKRLKDPLADYRGAIATPIDCDNYKKGNGDECGCDDGEPTSEQSPKENAS